MPAASQLSAPLQNSPSAHDVPAATGVWTQPLTGSQLSSVHALPSSHDSGVLVQLPTGSQTSSVQTSPSSQTSGVPAWQLPRPSQVSWPLQVSPSSHEAPAPSGVPACHVPATSHVSAPLQISPSSHDVPEASGVLEQPVTGSQTSTVQALESSQTSGVPV